MEEVEEEECGWTALYSGNGLEGRGEEPTAPHLHFWAQQAAVELEHYMDMKAAESASLRRALGELLEVVVGDWTGRWG